jgi:hypothetical protein
MNACGWLLAKACLNPTHTEVNPEMLEVELRYVTGCPHTDAARALLKECLTELKLDVAVEYKEGEYPSPTILVDGVDVMGSPASMVAACRLDVPTKARLLVALQAT